MTLAVVASVAVALIGYDVFIAVKVGQQATISKQLYQFSRDYPVVPFTVGFIFGHIFWVQT